MAKVILVRGEDIPENAKLDDVFVYLRYYDPNRNNDKYEILIKSVIIIETKDGLKEKPNGTNN